MAGPWEKFQPQKAGPWTKFQQSPRNSGPGAVDFASQGLSGLN